MTVGGDGWDSIKAMGEGALYMVTGLGHQQRNRCRKTLDSPKVFSSERYQVKLHQQSQEPLVVQILGKDMEAMLGCEMSHGFHQSWKPALLWHLVLSP